MSEQAYSDQEVAALFGNLTTRSAPLRNTVTDITSQPGALTQTSLLPALTAQCVTLWQADEAGFVNPASSLLGAQSSCPPLVDQGALENSSEQLAEATVHSVAPADACPAQEGTAISADDPGPSTGSNRRAQYIAAVFIDHTLWNGRCGPCTRAGYAGCDWATLRSANGAADTLGSANGAAETNLLSASGTDTQCSRCKARGLPIEDCAKISRRPRMSRLRLAQRRRAAAGGPVGAQPDLDVDGAAETSSASFVSLPESSTGRGI